MKYRLIIPSLILFNTSHLYGNICSTIADGEWNSPLVWDCNCLLTTCDTIVVSHAITLEEDLLLDLSILRITTNGSLSGPHELMLNGELINFGEINIRRLFTQSGFDLRNTGVISCTVMVSLSDSTFNEGSIVCTDSLVNGWLRPFITEGVVNTTVLYALGSYNNLGTTSSFRTTIRHCFNGGAMNILDTLSCGGMLWNDSIIHAMHLTTASSIFNYGEILVEGLLEHGVQGTADSRLEANSTIHTRDFINLDGSEIRGPGQLCIEGHAENHGVLRGSLIICDLSPTMVEPPYLDVNTGTCWMSVTYCANSSCTWTGMSPEAPVLAILFSPNPTVDLLHIQFERSSREVDRIEVRDLGGRLVQQLIGPFPERVVLPRTGLVAGTYLLRVLRTSGETMATQLVVFTD